MRKKNDKIVKIIKNGRFACKDIDGSIYYFRSVKHPIYGDMLELDTSTAVNKSSYKSSLSPIYETQSENTAVVSNQLDSVVNQTTNFEVDSEQAKIALPTELLPELPSTLSDNEFTQIKEFLAKPQRYASSSFPSTAVINDQIINIPNTWVLPSSVTAWIEKLRGFYGLKATLCVSFQMNATPYSSGRLRAAYYPNAEQNPYKADAHFTHWIPFSQLPGVEIECNKPNVVLKIPYIAPIKFHELTLASDSWGRLDVRVVAPYRTGPDNAQNATVIMWIWLEDVHLIGQTHRELVTQSIDDYETQGTVSEKETKPFTAFFTNVAKAAGSLKSIPVVSAYAGTAQWASQALAGLASAFGWSKPMSTPEVKRNVIGSMQFFMSGTGEDSCFPKSTLADAKLDAIVDTSLNGQDETSINFIKKHWSAIDTFTMTTAQTFDTRIWLQHNAPQANFRKIVSATETYLSPIGYLGHLFEMYRGGVEYKIKIAKTNFHRGSIQITYQPGPSIDVTVANSTYLYREVVDLADTSEILFTLPFINPIEYLTTDVSFGRVEIRILNPLQAPETVAGTIDFVVYARGADDLEFLQPKPPPYIPYVTQSMTEELQDISCVNFGPIGNSPTPAFSINPAVRAGSEIVLSLLQIGKRYLEYNMVYYLGVGDTVVDFYPYAFGCRSVVNGFTTGFIQSYLVAPYAYYRGGIRIASYEKTYHTDAADGYTLVTGGQTTAMGNGSPYFASYGAVTTRYLETGTSTVNGALTLAIPFQCTNRVTPVRFVNDLAGKTIAFGEPKAKVALDVSPRTTIRRAFADDFQLTFFCGIPRLADYP